MKGFDLTPIPSQTVGPFFHLGCTDRHSCGKLAGENTSGERITLRILLLDGACLPVDDGMIEIWQADADGYYASAENSELNHPPSAQADRQFTGFGRLATDREGAVVFETIRPGRVPDVTGKLQAPHIAVSVFARGLLQRLVTRVYFAGEPANSEDSALALVPPERRPSLMAQQSTAQPHEWTFTIHLSGDLETVFFDI